MNVREEFAIWLLKEAPISYRQYLGTENKSAIIRLNEINAFFPERDLFEVNGTNYLERMKYILFKINNKEHLHNPDFVAYDKFNSNGIPKAIIGKNNYLKFIKEKFEGSREINLNYWIFQGNPETFNTTEALRKNHLKHWKVVAHKDNIKPGDKVIIWQTGNRAGCYALAEVDSEVAVLEEDSSETEYYTAPQTSENTLRVKLKITSNLADAPILWSQIKDLPEFENFNAGNQGTNFRATEEEYEMLLKILESGKYFKTDGEKELREILQSHSKQNVVNYFKFLDTIIERFDIQSDDSRVVTGTSNKQLNLTIGQRYCWNLYQPKSKKGKFGLITKHRTDKTSEAFEGRGEQPFYNYFDDYSFALDHHKSAMSAITNELSRTNKSSFSDYNNEAYRKAIFDTDFRNFGIQS